MAHEPPAGGVCRPQRGSEVSWEPGTGFNHRQSSKHHITIRRDQSNPCRACRCLNRRFLSSFNLLRQRAQRFRAYRSARPLRQPCSRCNCRFRWTTGNGSVSPNKVTTSAGGIASAEFITGQPGTNALTASVTGLTSVSISVLAVPVTEAIASIEPAYPAVTLASWQPLSLPVTARNAAGQAVIGRTPTWSSSDNSVVTIQGGSLVGQSAGSATVTATLDGKTATVPVTVVKFAAIYAGPLETCALTAGGVLYCAGEAYGERAKPFAPELRWTQIDSHGGSSPSTTCGVTTAARLLCWGGNANGQLGIGDRSNRTVPHQVSLPAPVTRVALGAFHTCALTAPGDIYCWGKGDFGQLGNGLKVSSNTPVPVTSGTKFTQVVGGGNHTCALSSGGEVYCWGADELGQLGRGSAQPDSPTPAPVSGGILFRNISSRGAMTCGVASTGKAYCWGNNTGFLLGSVTNETCRDSEKPCSSVPRAVATSLTFDAVAAGTFNGCGLTTAGTVHCWGVDVQSTLGAPSGVPTTCPTDGTIRGCATTPLNGPIDFVTVNGSTRNYCGMRKNGGAYCWGTNAENQLGTPGLSESAVPRALGIDPTITPP